MCKDYFKRLTTVRYTSWDLNCRSVVSHTPARNRTEKMIRRHGRRIDRIFLRQGVDILDPHTI